MPQRSTGWIQDSGNIDNLIKVVELFDHNTLTHQELLNVIIPQKVFQRDGRDDLISELNTRNGHLNYPKISYKKLVGTAFSPRNTARCNGIIQALIPGQKRPFISDWPANNFIRWAETLGFIQYYPDDKYSITNLGLELTQASNINNKFVPIKKALLQYPPVTRILELLNNQYVNHNEIPNLTKFELGKELGFRGEDGFTTYPQHIVIQAIVEKIEPKNKILTNWEGSSDKYARMICSWISHRKINWVLKSPKEITVNIGTRSYTAIIPQSYKITIDGINAYRRSRARSRHHRISKRVFFEMLATKGMDKNYLRTRRALTIQLLKSWHSMNEIQSYLENNDIKDVPINVIENDITNFERIGLKIIKNRNDKYKLTDEIVNLVIPPIPTPELVPSYITKTKFILSQRINYVSHSFFDLIDFGFDGSKNRLYEFRIVELLNLINDLNAIHLSGGNRPEIVAYCPKLNPLNGIIMDSKAYKNGFSIPAQERDKMIRYISEYNQKDINLNNTRWWENFKSPDYPMNPIKYSFVSGRFIGHFKRQIQYILRQTDVNGGAITSEKLLEKVDSILNPNNEYSLGDFFEDLGCNGLVL